MRKMKNPIDVLKANLEAIKKTDPQFFDVKQRNEIAYKCRHDLKTMIAECRKIEESVAKSHDALDRIYLTYDLQFMKRQIHERFRQYKLSQEDARSMSDLYLKNSHTFTKQVSHKTIPPLQARRKAA